MFGRLFALSGREAEIGIDHFFHFDKIGADGMRILGVPHQRQLQPDARERSILRSWLTPASISVRSLSWRMIL